MESTFAGPQRGLIEMAIEPKAKADQEKFVVALAKFAAEDPLFLVATDQESGQTMIKGMSELHLDAKVDMLRRLHQVDVNVGGPQIAYLETITTRAEVDYTYKKQTYGVGQFARVKLIVEPDKGFGFESKMVSGAVPADYIDGVERGLISLLDSGVVAGFPVVDVKVTLEDGAYHETDSSALTFEIAARGAFREALQKGGPVLLEPIMKVEVMTPADCVNSVIADLKSRGAVQAQDIRQQDMRGDTTVITAMARLAHMFGYLNSLRSMTEGRGNFTMRFERYAVVPRRDDNPPFPPAIGMRA